jgi:hypothetical protein
MQQTIRSLSLMMSLLLLPGAAFAAKDKPRYNPNQKVEGLKKKHEGWKKKIDLGASFSLSQNSNVVGSTDGTSLAMGATVKSAFDWARGNHEWLNKFNVQEIFTYTSSLEEFVKTTDEIKLRSAYLYHISSIPWLGPFGELKLKTALFRGRDVRNKDVVYAIKKLDGTIENLPLSNTLRLTDAFAPLTLEQMVGAFARPIEKDNISLEVRLGFSAKQTFADNQRALSDDADTDEIEVKETETIYQGGPALGVFLDGNLLSKKLLYYAQFESMLPAINNKADNDDRNAADLTNLAFEAGFSLKVVSWASLSYSFKAIREPQLVDTWQLQNNLLVTFTYSLMEG